MGKTTTRLPSGDQNRETNKDLQACLRPNKIQINPINIKHKRQKKVPVDQISVIKEVSVTQESPPRKITSTVSLERIMEVANIH